MEIVKTYPYFVWMSLYIVGLIVVTCLVTAPIFVEVSKVQILTSTIAIEVRIINLIFHNSHSNE